MDTHETMGTGVETGPKNILKSCPACGDTFAPERSFCSRDGYPLLKPTDPKFCPRCHRIFERAKRYCSHDGSRLVDHLPVTLPVETTLVIGEVTFGARKLGKEESESFSRSLCPNCDHWENWIITGKDYVCKGCLSTYNYGEQGVFEILGQVGSGGVLIPRKAGKAAIKAEKTPMEEFLLSLSPSNKAHWLKRFNRFDERKFNLSWNWPSFFFGPLRYFIKGIWPLGILYCMGAGFIFYAFHRFWFQHFLLWYTLSGAFFGIMGSNDYYRFCLKYRDDIPGAKRARSIGMLCFWLLILSPVILFIMMIGIF